MAAEYEVNIKINTQQIERELKKVDKAVSNIGKGKGGKKQPILALPSTEMLNATARKIQSLDKVNRRIALRQREINKQTRDQALSIDTLVKTQEKRARLLNKINEMEAKGLNVSRLRKQLAKATTEQSNRRFGSAEKEFRILEKSIRLEQSKLRILKEQRKGFASSPVGGTRTMMGSPAQIAAAARAGGATSPIRGGLGFPGSPAFLAGATVSRTPFGPSFPTGGAALPIRGSTAIAGSPKAIQAAKATELRAVEVQGSWSKALGQLQETAEIIAQNAQKAQIRAQVASAGLTGQSSPVGGATNIPGSPAFLRRQRRNKTLEQVGLGAGFPLLFGGGAGSVLGGGLGGLTGSFGAQIALSAIGQQIDQFIAGVVNAGKALTSVGGAAEFMAEKSLFSSDAMQFRIEKLIEEGDVTKAAALMTQEMAKQVGGSGLKALKDLGTEANKMGKLFNALILQVQAFISRALTPLLAAINKVVGDIVLNNQFNALMSEATGARAKKIEEFLKPFTKTVRKGAAAKDVVTSEGKRLAIEKFGGQFIPEGAAIEPTRLETLRAGDSRTSEQKRQERLIEASNRRIANLKAEAVKVKEVSAIRGRIAAAQAAENDQLVERLRGEERAAGILREKARLLAAIPDNLNEAKRLEEETQIVLTTDAKLLANQEETQRRIAKVIRDEQLKAVKELEQVYQGVGDIVKEGLVDGIQSAIRGTKSLTEVLSNMFDRLSNKFMDLAANISLYGNQQGTLSKGSGLFGSLFSAVLPALIPGSTSTKGLDVDLVQQYMYADGGFVNRPTNAVIGEGGESEYVIPSSKMTEAMGRYARGARGAAVIPEGDGVSPEGGMGGGSGVVDVRYSVERINNVDYVTAAEFERGMNQAAKRGAELGRQGVYSDLVNKRSIRSRVGV